MAISITKPTVGGNEDTWGTTLNTGLTAIESTFNGSGTGKVTVSPDLSTLTINGTNVTSTPAELNKLDGFTGTFADLNYAKDLNATGVTTSEFDKLDGLTSSTSELNTLDGFTGTATDLNYAKDLRATGVTTSEFDKLDGLTVTTSELNVLDGNTSATSTTVAAADRVVLNDNGTMKQVSMSDIATYTTSQVSTSTVNNPTITIDAGMNIDGGGTFTLNQAGNTTITLNHTDTSGQASVNNSGSTYIQDITLDGFGHVTGITSTDVASNISSSGFNSAGSVVGASVRSSTQVSFSTGISVPNGKTIFGWGSDQSNMGLAWRSNWQGSVQSLTNYGNPFTNNTGSAVTVYGWVSTSGSATRSAVYMMFG
tara:strand:+ start:2193 stop:3296 length:1104 start_codon:yes stop_codon:yes gene_type:complete